MPLRCCFEVSDVQDRPSVSHSLPAVPVDPDVELLAILQYHVCEHAATLSTIMGLNT